MHRLLLLPLVLLLAGHALAQTDDHEEEDKRYQERLKPPRGPDGSPPPTNRAGVIQMADGLIRESRDYRSKTTPRWQIRTDDPAIDVAEAAAYLDAFSSWFDGFWKEKIALTKTSELGRVYVFTSFHDYNRLLTGGGLHGAFRPAGHYNLVTDVIALYLGAIGKGRFDDVLVHEAAHMLVSREIHGGRPSPPWLSEGLAGYFECTAWDKKLGFQEGVVAGSSAKDWLREFKKLASGEPAWSVESLLGGADFYSGEGTQGRYAASWVLVHALFHAEQGRFRDGFTRFLAGATSAEGASPERLYEAVGLDAAKLTEVVVAHARAIDVR